MVAITRRRRLPGSGPCTPPSSAQSRPRRLGVPPWCSAWAASALSPWWPHLDPTCEHFSRGMCTHTTRVSASMLRSNTRGMRWWSEPRSRTLAVCIYDTRDEPPVLRDRGKRRPRHESQGLHGHGSASSVGSDHRRRFAAAAFPPSTSAGGRDSFRVDLTCA